MLLPISPSSIKGGSTLHAGSGLLYSQLTVELDLGAESLDLRPRQIAKHRIAVDAPRQGLDAGGNVHVVLGQLEG